MISGFATPLENRLTPIRTWYFLYRFFLLKSEILHICLIRVFIPISYNEEWGVFHAPCFQPWAGSRIEGLVVKLNNETGAIRKYQ